MKNLEAVFWDVDTNKLDFEKQSDFIIARILEHGWLDDIKWLLKKYAPGKIRKAICQSRDLSEKTANFWSIYLKIPKGKILCLNKSYLKKRKIFWPY